MSGADLDLLTTDELAVILRVPVKTVRYWRQTRQGPRGVRLGKRVLYNRRDVAAWWDARVAEEPHARRYSWSVDS